MSKLIASTVLVLINPPEIFNSALLYFHWPTPANIGIFA
jgi:hypothetical protein